jgi:hypothetical protein
VLTQIANIQEMDQYVQFIVALSLNTYIVPIPFFKIVIEHNNQVGKPHKWPNM